MNDECVLAQFYLLDSVDIKHSLEEGFFEGVILKGRLIDGQQIEKVVDVSKGDRVFDAKFSEDGLRFFDDFFLFFNTLEFCELLALALHL